jgi:membrane protease YdiL (CAAX protease family)
MIAAFYAAVVTFMWLAFVAFGTDDVLGLFLCFATALLIGVIGPVVYTVWTRSGSLHDLGLRRDDLPKTLTLAAVFAAVQFAITLWGYDLPAAVDWVPLLVMALVVGVFESVFFRGFVQNRLEAHYGSARGVGGAALLYGLYHFGYGMGWTDIAFLTGLGITYAVAFSLTRNLLVLWPMLTPLGSFYAQLQGGEIELPWASIMGFGDVAMLMAGALWIAYRHEQKRRTPSTASVA